MDKYKAEIGKQNGGAISIRKKEVFYMTYVDEGGRLYEDDEIEDISPEDFDDMNIREYEGESREVDFEGQLSED